MIYGQTESDPKWGFIPSFLRNQIHNYLRLIFIFLPESYPFILNKFKKNVRNQIQKLRIRSKKLGVRSIVKESNAKHPESDPKYSESDPKLRNQIQYYFIIQDWDPIMYNHF